MLQEALQDTVPWQAEPAQDEREHESNDDFDAEGLLILDFEDDAEYSEPDPSAVLGLPH